MAGQIRCQQITRRGRPCRNPALPNSNPPRCARHQPKPATEEAVAIQPYLPTLLPEEEREPASKCAPRRAERKARPTPPANQPYLPGFSPEELAQLDSDGLSPNLNREVQEVRVVVLRLLRLWGDPAQPISAEEARRLAALIFSGARTVAHLLSRQTKEGSGQDWLAQVLDELGGKYGINL